MNEQLYELVYGILQDHSPTDCEAFATVGRQMISSRLESRTGVRTGDPKEFGFAVGLDTGLLMAHLVAGTLAVIESCVSLRRLKEEAAFRSELQKAWEECLIKRGVPETIAHLAAQQRLGELLRIIEDELRRD